MLSVISIEQSYHTPAVQMLQDLPENPDTTPSMVCSAIVANAGTTGTAQATTTKSKPKNHAAGLKEVRQATRVTLTAMHNAIASLIPEFSFSWLQPAHPLAPVRPDQERVAATALEKKGIEIFTDLQVHWVRSEKGEARWDCLFPSVAQHHRLSLVCDEGSPGMAACQYLAAKGFAVCVWRDPSHKMQRLHLRALQENPRTKTAVDHMRPVFKISRAPWGSRKFGCQLAEARGRLITALREGSESARTLLDMFGPSIIVDSCGVLTTNSSTEQIVAYVEQASGHVSWWAPMAPTAKRETNEQ